MIPLGRRRFLGLTGSALVTLASGCAGQTGAGAGRRVVVVGGGFGGIIAAKVVRTLDPSIEVTLIERNLRHVSCPFSNHVLAGFRPIGDITLGYDAVAARHGIRMIFDEAVAIDPDGGRVATRHAGEIGYDRLIVSPGIDFRAEQIEGYDQAVSALDMPHAWVAGEQTLLLRRQLDAMADGGTVLITVPLFPYRCPPGPYERACLVAAWLQRHKPRSKVVVLDANPEIVSLAPHFRKAWDTLYKGMIERHPGVMVTQADGRSRTLVVEGIEAFTGDVVNLIPPQRAAALATKAGLTGGGNWCPVAPHTFESTVHPGIHVIGDAAQAGAMPKSGHAANCQAKACAANVVALLNDRPIVDFAGLNVCYTALAADQAVSVAAAYRVADGVIAPVAASVGTSPLDFSTAKREAVHADSWLRNILGEMSA